MTLTFPLANMMVSFRSGSGCTYRGCGTSASTDGISVSGRGVLADQRGLNKIEAAITEDKQPEELAAVAAQLRDLWRDYYQRHPPQIDRTLIEFTLKQLRQHLAAVRRDAKDDEAAMKEAIDIEEKIEIIMQSDDYQAVYNRLSLFEAKHVNPLINES